MQPSKLQQRRRAAIAKQKQHFKDFSSGFEAFNSVLFPVPLPKDWRICSDEFDRSWTVTLQRRALLVITNTQRNSALCVRYYCATAST